LRPREKEEIERGKKNENKITQERTESSKRKRDLKTTNNKKKKNCETRCDFEEVEFCFPFCVILKQ